MPASKLKRLGGRKPDQLRSIRFEADIAKNALSSVLCCFGKTQVICAVKVEDSLPRWMKEQNVAGGWITAEYSMLPYSTETRKPRDISRGKLDGRSAEIQRLIGRSLRAVCDLSVLGERTIWIDCDVLCADGGTRTAAITGAIAALEIARLRLEKLEKTSLPLMRGFASAVSVGIVNGEILLDLDFSEDSIAELDMNVVMTDDGKFVEIQASSERDVFTKTQFRTMLMLAEKGCREISHIRNKFLKKFWNPFLRKKIT